MSKRLGRPKGKNKNPEAGTLLHVVLSPTAKQRLEQVRTYYRCETYNKGEHGATPSALPRINNETLIDLVIDNVYHMTMTEPETLAGLLTLKGCQNAYDLVGLPEGPEE